MQISLIILSNKDLKTEKQKHQRMLDEQRKKEDEALKKNKFKKLKLKLILKILANKE